jgi:hypothetical protein
MYVIIHCIYNKFELIRVDLQVYISSRSQAMSTFMSNPFRDHVIIKDICDRDHLLASAYRDHLLSQTGLLPTLEWILYMKCIECMLFVRLVDGNGFHLWENKVPISFVVNLELEIDMHAIFRFFLFCMIRIK